MGTYRITIDRTDNPTDEPTITVIEFSTRYILQEDLAEWVREEIDGDATITTIPRTVEPITIRLEMGDKEPVNIYEAKFCHEYDVPEGCEGVSIWQGTRVNSTFYEALSPPAQALIDRIMDDE